MPQMLKRIKKQAQNILGFLKADASYLPRAVDALFRDVIYPCG